MVQLPKAIELLVLKPCIAYGISEVYINYGGLFNSHHGARFYINEVIVSMVLLHFCKAFNSLVDYENDELKA